VTDHPVVKRGSAPLEAPLVVGIDLGGTKLLGGIAGRDGAVRATFSEPTRHGAGAPVLQQMADMVTRLLAETGAPRTALAHVVIGVPGVVSPRTGLASLSPNLALPADRPLADLEADLIGCPVSVENDANLAAYAEATVGAGKGERSLAFISFGTGVGMGLVIEGELMRGEHGRAGEIGYLPVGAEPHLRASASENGLFEDEVGTVGIRRHFAADGETVAELFARAENGNAQAAAGIDQIARRAAVGLAAIHSLVDPAVTAIGGGIGAQPRFHQRLVEHVKALLPFSCRIEPSQLGTSGGMVGAVMLGLKRAA
jgi:glucokinase